jgi:Cysteine-rich CPCC
MNGCGRGLEMSDPIKDGYASFEDFCRREDPEYLKGKNGKFQCPCCFNFTLGEVAAYDICPVCFWEDDGTTNEHGFSPNDISLDEGRINFQKYGASTERSIHRVRPSKPDEKPENDSISEK